MNPGMSSWIALTRRIAFEPGNSVLVLGATGNAGHMAAEIAKHLGASTVIAAGRNPERLAALPALGADATISLSGDQQEIERRLGEIAAEVDVVLDYLWGPVTERVLPATPSTPSRPHWTRCKPPGTPRAAPANASSSSPDNCHRTARPPTAILESSAVRR
jgi:NADPH-dependent curcumin reductase CurA